MLKKLLLLITTLVLFTSCQLPTANYLRDRVFPEDNTTKLALSPILLPTYIIGCVTDIAIVNPARGTLNVPQVSKQIWGWQNKEPWLGYGALLPVKLIAIPGAAVGTTMFSEQFIYSDKKLGAVDEKSLDFFESKSIELIVKYIAICKKIL